jgi:hypothetical protein
LVRDYTQLFLHRHKELRSLKTRKTKRIISRVGLRTHGTAMFPSLDFRFSRPCSGWSSREWTFRTNDLLLEGANSQVKPKRQTQPHPPSLSAHPNFIARAKRQSSALHGSVMHATWSNIRLACAFSLTLFSRIVARRST